MGNYFFLNGQEYFISFKCTIGDLIQYCKYNDTLIVIEYNNLICEKKNWNTILIQKDDKIEIITIVGGG